MDEPTASLDFGNQVRVLSRVRTVAGEGIAVIVSSHDPDQARRRRPTRRSRRIAT
jgi:iron complex transport system ATP-binding protein